MRRRFVILGLVVILLLVIGGWYLLRGRSDNGPDTDAADLDCCQCVAIGKDQSYPFPKVPGETCEEHCYKGCLERGQSELTCKLGGVGGYALKCPDVLQPTVTPYGE